MKQPIKKGVLLEWGEEKEGLGAVKSRSGLRMNCVRSRRCSIKMSQLSHDLVFKRLDSKQAQLSGNTTCCIRLMSSLADRHFGTLPPLKGIFPRCTSVAYERKWNRQHRSWTSSSPHGGFSWGHFLARHFSRSNEGSRYFGAKYIPYMGL